MSDRIDELVTSLRGMFPHCTLCFPDDTDTTCQRCIALAELATIARGSAGVHQRLHQWSRFRRCEVRRIY